MKTIWSFFCFFCLSLIGTQAWGQTYKTVQMKAFQIYFDKNKHDVTSEAKAILDSIAFILEKNNTLLLEVQGHTDSRGSYSSNMLLSEKRVTNVLNYFAERSVDTTKIKKLAMGENKLAVKEVSDEALSKNRRVEIFISRNFLFKPLTGIVLDDSTGLGLKAKVFLNSLFYKDSVSTDSAGKYSILIPEGLNSLLTIRSKKYMFEQIPLKTGSIAGSNVLTHKIAKLTANKKLTIKNIYFKGGEDVILETSLNALMALQNVLIENPTLAIEIQGHVNHPGAPAGDPNHTIFKLSEARAKAVYMYLIENNIAPERLGHKGFSNFFMVFPSPKSEEQHAANRRVEIFVKKI